MLNHTLNDLNLKSVLPARFANLIAENKESYSILDNLNDLIYSASLKGKKTITLELIRSNDYDECKEFQRSLNYGIIASELKTKGYKVYFTFNLDESKEEYYGEILVDWS